MERGSKKFRLNYFLCTENDDQVDYFPFAKNF